MGDRKTGGFSLPRFSKGRNGDESRTITHLLLTLVALALLTSGIAIAFLIRRADVDANRLAAAAIAGAIDRESARIGNETYINAHWDDAAAHIYGTPDPVWLKSQWGTSNANNYLIDAQGRILFTHLQSGRTTPLRHMVSPAILTEIARRMPATEAAVRQKGGATVLLGAFGRDPALIAFSPVVRERGPAPLSRATFRTFVDIRILDHKVLAEWSRGFNLPGLHWTAPDRVGADEAASTIRDATGRPLGTIAWRRLAPAIDALDAIAPVLAGSGLLFLIVAGIVIGRVRHLNRALAAKSRLAAEAAAQEQAARLVAEQALGEAERARGQAEQARREAEAQAQRRAEAEVRHRAELRTVAHGVADELQATVGALIHSLRASADALDESSDVTLATIVEQHEQAEAAHAMASQANGATAALIERIRLLSANVDDIAEEALRAAETTLQATGHSTTVRTTNEALIDSVTSIERSSDRIATISKATNLLALNATLEAVRAGDLGRGFAVVAQEVRHFSQQTAGTTREIADRILDISSATGSAVRASEALRASLTALAAGAEQTVAMTRRQHDATAEMRAMMGEIEVSTVTACDTFRSLKETFGTTSGVALRTRTIGADVRRRTEALQGECDRMVATLRMNAAAAAAAA